MARYTDASCKLCRRIGEKLFLKGTRCQTDKCAATKRPFAPGQHGKLKSKTSDYGLQVREKQKVKRIYGILERQFHKYFEMASRAKGITGAVLLQLLERRLDNVIYKLSFTTSRNQARQLVRHKQVFVNGRPVNLPSYQVKVGDKIELRPKEGITKIAKTSNEVFGDKPVPVWIKREKDVYKAEIIGLPTRDDVQFPVNENLIVELYSK